jgi:ABC-type dipeptide/oligopeptide/nickel transport system permease component
MTRFALTRLASLVGILLGLSVVVFLLEAVVPADPVRAMVGASATPQIVEAKRHEFGLDRPLPAQYAHFLSRAVRGDLSMSLYTRRPVRTDIASFLPATVELAAAALVLAVVLGGVLGLLTARGGGTTLRVGLVASASVPAFLLALLLLMVFYAKLRWFPGSGRISPRAECTNRPHRLAHHRRAARRPPRRRGRCARPSGLTGLVSGTRAGGRPGTDAAVVTANRTPLRSHPNGAGQGAH